MPRLVATGARNITFPIKNEDGVMERLEFTPLIPVNVKKNQMKQLENCHLFIKLTDSGEIREAKKGDSETMTKKEIKDLAEKDSKGKEDK